MRIFNVYSREKEEFVPINNKKVNMYACGITVYDDCHVGHARQAITFDIISQYLRYKGYDVTYVRNYTDVDDKIIARANSLGINTLSYSRKKIEEAEEDLLNLGIIDADIKPKASEYIGKIIIFIEGLISKGHAYANERGDVYFSVCSFAEYGKLSNRNTEELLNGVRKDVEEGKESPFDFALWKSAKDGEIFWVSPWGKGRPGWHIECSAMVLDTLGESIDIHGGGKDLIFPHHENEIAQSEAFTGKSLAKYWVHNGLITINGQKMSKSLGNSMTIKQALEKYNSEIIRYAMLEKHYSTDIDLNEKVFSLAEKQLYYIYNTLAKINAFSSMYGNDASGRVIDKSVAENIEKNFTASMDDDFNTAAAISDLFYICRYVNTLMVSKKYLKEDILATLTQIKEKLVQQFSIIGLLRESPEEFVVELRNKHLNHLRITSNYIEGLILQRNDAKANRNYEMADNIRNMLLEQGIILNDSRDGTSWDIKELYSITAG
jgi:cysteinyl-tRNA synthetase